MKEVQDMLFPTQVRCSRWEKYEHEYQPPCRSEGKADNADVCVYKSVSLCLWLLPLDISETNTYHDVLRAGCVKLHLSVRLQGKIINDL